MKVIFLDIDGVLNVCSLERDMYGSLFHEEFVNNLGHIIDSTNASIVISSSWRYSGLDTMKCMWKYRCLPGEVIDITPFKSKKEKSSSNWTNLPFHERNERGEEINDWLELHPEVTSYCIIDDDDDFTEEQRKHFVQTFLLEDKDSIQGYGLTRNCASQAIIILNN